MPYWPFCVRIWRFRLSQLRGGLLLPTRCAYLSQLPRGFVSSSSEGLGLPPLPFRRLRGRQRLDFLRALPLRCLSGDYWRGSMRSLPRRVLRTNPLVERL